MARSKRPGWLARLVHRLNDPKDEKAAWTVAGLLLLFETALCALIISKVPYTEIDWEAYMEEVQGYQEGERDYTKLKGGTGPLVYPAGFVYIFSWLRTITGGAVPPAQAIFAALYLATQFVVMMLYIRSRSLPPWSLALLCLSRRMHSIFVLRLFNDCWAMLVAYLATLALQARRWTLAIFLYSLAVSIKMNVLLFAPGVLAAVLKEATPGETLRGVAAGVILQIILGGPFLMAYPQSYVSRAFEFSRVFMFKWTVNWHFLPEEWFISSRFALLLLALHLRLLWSIALRSWFIEEEGAWLAIQGFFSRGSTSPPGDSKNVAADKKEGKKGKPLLNNDRLLSMVFVANYVGIVCARSLHYQFYSWYFHMLPFILLRSRLPLPVSLSLLAGIEVVWNLYPPSAAASAALLAMHLVALWGAWALPAPYPMETKVIGARPAPKRR